MSCTCPAPSLYSAVQLWSGRAEGEFGGCFRDLKDEIPTVPGSCGSLKLKVFVLLLADLQKCKLGTWNLVC